MEQEVETCTVEETTAHSRYPPRPAPPQTLHCYVMTLLLQPALLLCALLHSKKTPRVLWAQSLQVIRHLHLLPR